MLVPPPFLCLVMTKQPSRYRSYVLRLLLGPSFLLLILVTLGVGHLNGLVTLGSRHANLTHSLVSRVSSSDPLTSRNDPC